MELAKILETCKGNLIISDMFTKANQVINNSGYNNIVCSISGGADSDVMLDVIEKVKNPDVKITYVWFDTGLEYKATKDHLNYLEDRYNIQIHKERAVKPIPLCVKEYGQPFLSKIVSQKIENLQAHGFNWEDEPYEVLVEKYPNTKDGLNWWCNRSKPSKEYVTPRFNIDLFKYLKEFMVENPPWFKISRMCCIEAKKKTSQKFIDNIKCDLMILGIRKSEGGIRAVHYKGCWDRNEDQCDKYRPLFWMLDKDKDIYDLKYNIHHSDCYTKWGFLRTGCVGCPYNRNLLEDLSQVELFEPNMYKAVNTVFRDSYEYTRQYRKFIERKKFEEKYKHTKRLF